MEESTLLKEVVKALDQQSKEINKNMDSKINDSENRIDERFDRIEKKFDGTNPKVPDPYYVNVIKHSLNSR